MNSKMTIGWRFTLTAGVLMLLTLIMATISLVGIKGFGKEANSLTGNTVPGIVWATAMNYDVADMRVWQLRYIHATRQEEMRQMLQERAKDRQKFDDALKNYTPTVIVEEDRQNFAKLKMQMDINDQSWAKTVQLREENQADEAIKQYFAEVLPNMISTSGLLDEMVLFNRKCVDVSTASINSTMKAAWSFTIMTGAVALIVGALIAWFMISSLNKQMSQVVSELTEGAEQIASAASQVSSSSQSLAQGSSEQAASIEETSASSEEINSMARKNTDNSRSMASLMSQSQEMFVRTNSQLGEMVVSMDEINESSGKISKIIKVIDEIAFQTNILALNAAVEAARAGEAGMGFAVVADEVRSLAQRSAQAAKDTALLIEESIAKSNAGKHKVDQVAMAIQSITADSSKIKTLVDEVSLGSEEQSRGLEQIARAITQMEQVTQTTAANAEESAAAAEELNAQSEALRDVVHRLNAMVGGQEEIGHSVLLRTKVSSPAKQSARVVVSSIPTASRSRVHGDEKKSFPLETAFHEF